MPEPTTHTEPAPALSETFRPIVIPPQPTGRRIITFHKGVSSSEMAKLLKQATGSDSVSASAAGSESAAIQQTNATGHPLVIERFGLAAVGGGAERAASAAGMLATFAEVADVRPEFWMFALGDPPWEDSATSTWGLDAVNCLASKANGNGIKLAVLDTGIDLGHPDFAGRHIVTDTFVPDETVDDVQGHGTHCAGTAASAYAGGGNLPRYGVAQSVELHIGKVLNNRGSGRELDIIAGIEWAIGQGCQVISMSLGRATAPHEPFIPAYEDIAKIALEEGCLIVCAAGNDSDRRYGYVAPVGSPANAPSIMAVAAIGSDGGIASFSCGGTGIGKVDVCAPGVAVFSSVPRPQLYKKLPGTSMACPHVAGIAALWAQSDAKLRGQKLWGKLLATSIDVGNLKPIDVGAGLVQAPK